MRYLTPNSTVSVNLYHREFEGNGTIPCVIVHGLLGSSRNWLTAGKALADQFHCYAVDLRNHGMSPHTNSMKYPEMAKDVLDWMDSQNLNKAVLIGHSMGGKVCMQMAVDYPERVIGIVVIDISNQAYKPRWEAEFVAMNELRVETLKSRAEAEAALEPVVTDWAFRKFLCSNLERNPNGSGFRWTINLEIIYNCLIDLFRAVPDGTKAYEGPSLFIRGEYSKFLLEEHLESIRTYFPEASLKTVAKAGHNVHFDNLIGFIEAMKGFPK